MNDPKERNVLYCQCDNGQCVSEIGFEDGDNPKHCLGPRWRITKAKIAFDLAFNHNKMPEWEFRRVKPLESFTQSGE